MITDFLTKAFWGLVRKLPHRLAMRIYKWNLRCLVAHITAKPVVEPKAEIVGEGFSPAYAELLINFLYRIAEGTAHSGDWQDMQAATQLEKGEH
jgi:hypothetical protein